MTRTGLLREGGAAFVFLRSSRVQTRRYTAVIRLAERGISKCKVVRRESESEGSWLIKSRPNE
jgi:hypothetical protein